MLSADAKLAKYMDGLGKTNPDGRHFVTVPWQDVTPNERSKLPMYLTREFPISETIKVLAWMMCIIGLFSPLGVCLAFGIALLITMHISNRQAWKTTASWDILKIDYPNEVAERADFNISVIIKNNSEKYPLYNLIVGIRFAGSQKEFRCNFVELIPRSGSATVRFSFKSDRGMGIWPISDVTVTARDALGLKFLSLEYPHNGSIQVNPQHIPLSRFEIERAGLSLHTGDYEVKAAGHSTSFLGLRDWRVGDSLTHIDWKRSVRSGNLLVKEFERMCATDATIFIDITEFGHGNFAGISTIETLKDSTLSAMRCLISQQVQVQVISANMHIPLGKSFSHIEYITSYIRDLKPAGNTSFSKIVLDNLHLVPTDSVVIMIFCSANTDMKNLTQSFILLDDRRVETNLAVINTDSFFTKIREGANLTKSQNQVVDYVMSAVEQQTQNKEVQRILGKIMEKMYMITPGSTLADIYNLKHGN